MIAFLAAPPGLKAAEPPQGVAAASYSAEVWSGAEAFQRAWSIYAGATLIPPGATAEEGLRLRFVAGQSQYRTDTASGPGRGVSPFADALLGYQQQLGPVTVKTFAGVAAIANLRSSEDAADPWGHAQFGPKAVLETWWTINEGAWASLDLAWSQPHQSYYSRIRAALRPVAQISLGLEGGVVGNSSGNLLRVGPFVRYEWREGEVSLSGGLASDGALGWLGGAQAGGEAGAYATFNWLQRF